MKQYLILFVVIAIQAVNCDAGDGQRVRQIARLHKALFDPDGRANMIIINHDVRLADYTNSISNTNLFTPQDQDLVQEIKTKYANVTTNYAPPGSRLLSVAKTNGDYVEHFIYTNSNACEDIVFPGPTRHPVPWYGKGEGYAKFVSSYTGFLTVAKYRTRNLDGYDVFLHGEEPGSIRNTEVILVQIKGDIPNGLYVKFDGGQFFGLMRFVNGKVQGKWFFLDAQDETLFETKTKAPVDYFKVATQEGYP